MALHGKTILTTQAAISSTRLRDGLVALGARVLECPVIQIVPPENWRPVDEAIAKLRSYNWLLFTSASGVSEFMKRVEWLSGDCTVPVAVVGSATAASLAAWDLLPSLMPTSFRAEGILDAFPQDLTGVRILFPRAETARELLPEELRRRGAVVDVVVVYRTIETGEKRDLREILAMENIDCVVFTSASAIQSMAGKLGDDFRSALERIPVAVIGPVTRQVAESFGLHPAIQPERATLPDLVEAIRTGLTSQWKRVHQPTDRDSDDKK